MTKPDLNSLVRILIAVLSLGFITTLVVVWVQQSKTGDFTLAAGAQGGESYILGSALKEVVERHYPRIHIALQETGARLKICRCWTMGVHSWRQRSRTYLQGRRFVPLPSYTTTPFNF